MNKNQRAKLLKAKLLIEKIIEEEETKYANLPESLQHSQVGEAFEEAIEWLEQARDALHEVGV